jgi:hypothetical protein
MKKLIFMIMALFGLAIAFSGCSKISLKPKSLGPYSIIPNRPFSSIKSLKAALKIKAKENMSYGYNKLAMLEKKEGKWCQNMSKNPKFIKIRQKLFKLPAGNTELYYKYILISSKSYYGRVLYNCSYFTLTP